MKPLLFSIAAISFFAASPTFALPAPQVTERVTVTKVDNVTKFVLEQPRASMIQRDVEKRSPKVDPEGFADPDPQVTKRVTVTKVDHVTNYVLEPRASVKPPDQGLDKRIPKVEPEGFADPDGQVTKRVTVTKVDHVTKHVLESSPRSKRPKHRIHDKRSSEFFRQLDPDSQGSMNSGVFRNSVRGSPDLVKRQEDTIMTTLAELAEIRKVVGTAEEDLLKDGFRLVPFEGQTEELPIALDLVEKFPVADIDPIVVATPVVLNPITVEATPVRPVSGYLAPEELEPSPSPTHRAPVWTKGVFQKAGAMIPLILALTLGLVFAIFTCLKYCTKHEDDDALPVASRTGLPPSFRPALAHGRTDTGASRGEREHRHPHGLMSFRRQGPTEASQPSEPNTAGATDEEHQPPISHQPYPRPGQFPNPETYGNRIMNFGSILGRIWNPLAAESINSVEEEKPPCPGFQTAENPIEISRLDRFPGSQHLSTTIVLRMAADRLADMSDADRVPKAIRGRTLEKKAEAAATGSERHPDNTARRRKGLRDVWLDDIVNKKAPGTEHISKGKKPDATPSASKTLDDQKRISAPVPNRPNKAPIGKLSVTSSSDSDTEDSSGSDESETKTQSANKPANSTPEAKKPRNIRIGETSRASPTFHTAPTPHVESAVISDGNDAGPSQTGTARRVRIQSPVPQESSAGGWASTSQDSSVGSSDGSSEPEPERTAGPIYNGPVPHSENEDSEDSSSSAESLEFSPTSESKSKIPVPQKLSRSPSNIRPRRRMSDTTSPIREGKKPVFSTTPRMQSSPLASQDDDEMPGAFPRPNPRSKPSFDSSLTHKAKSAHPPSSSEGSSSAGSSRSSTPAPQTSPRLQIGPLSHNPYRRESSDMSDAIKHHARRNIRRAPTDGAGDTDVSEDEDYPPILESNFFEGPRRMPISVGLFCKSPFELVDGSDISMDSTLNSPSVFYSVCSGDDVKHGETVVWNETGLAH